MLTLASSYLASGQGATRTGQVDQLGLQAEGEGQFQGESGRSIRFAESRRTLCAGGLIKPASSRRADRVANLIVFENTYRAFRCSLSGI